MTDWPHVTGVLKGVGLIDTTFLSEFGRDRGTAVHQATALDDVADLDEGSVDPHVAPYLAAWRRFRAESSPITFPKIEHRVRHELYGYLGTADRVARFRGSDWVIDLKTGGPEPWHALQLAAYALAYLGRTSLAGSGVRCAAVYLRDDATYRFMPYEDYSDGDAWLVALSLYNWKLKHGLLKPEVRDVI